MSVQVSAPSAASDEGQYSLFSSRATLKQSWPWSSRSGDSPLVQWSLVHWSLGDWSLGRKLRHGLIGLSFVALQIALTSQLAVGQDLEGLPERPRKTFPVLKADPLEIKSVNLLPVAGQPDKRSLRLRLVSVPRCVLGDFEAILYDRVGSPASGIVVAVEPVLPDDSSFIGSSAVIADPQEILRGTFESGFEIPYSNTPTVYGLYVCKKTLPDEVCRNKPVEPINDILGEHSTDPKLRKRFFKDRTYFFSFVVVEGETAVISKAALGPDSRNELYAWLLAKVGGHPRFEEVFETIWRRIKTLGPYPLGSTSQSIAITLPHYDQKKCQALKDSIGVE